MNHSHPEFIPREYCCIGTPWNNGDISKWGEPLPQRVIDVAKEYSLDAHDVHWHLEAVHGWESHDEGYSAAVVQAAKCLLAGGCK